VFKRKYALLNPSILHTNKQGRSINAFFKILILKTNIRGLIDAFLVHYYSLQINKLNKFNVRMYISCLFFYFCK